LECLSTASARSWRAKRAITADTAARLGVFFGMGAEFCLNLQAHHDLVLAREVLADRLAAITPLAMAA